MSNIHANQPHIHLQQHSITHSSHSYGVEKISTAKPLKTINFIEGHRVLWSLVTIFAVLLITLAGLQFLPSLLSTTFNTSEDQAPLTSINLDAQLLSEYSTHAGKLIISTARGLRGLHFQNQEIVDFQNTALQSHIGPSTRINKQENTRRVVLYETNLSSQITIIDGETTAVHNLSNQLNKILDQPILTDVLWESDSPVLYLIVSGIENNFRQYFVFKYKVDSQQLSSIKLNLAQDPTLLWFNGVNQRLFIGSKLPSGSYQLHTITRFQHISTATIPELIISKASQNGQVLILHNDRLGISRLGDTAGNIAYLDIDVLPSQIVNVYWHNRSNRLSLATQDARVLTLQTFLFSGAVGCSEIFPQTQSVFTTGSEAYLILEQTSDTKVVSSENCQTFTPSSDDLGQIRHFHGTL